jgi:hypothetical protein
VAIDRLAYPASLEETRLLWSRDLTTDPRGRDDERRADAADPDRIRDDDRDARRRGGAA